MKSLIFKQTEILACQVYMDGKPFACLRCDRLYFDSKTGNVHIFVGIQCVNIFYHVNGVCINEVIE